jgi:hypothetical protein
MDEDIKRDLHRLINHLVDTAETFLTQMEGEFYPFGAVIQSNGELIPVGYWDGNERPLSAPMIEALKRNFEERAAKKEIIAYAITYDSLARPSADAEKSDTIVIDYFDTRTNQLTEYYYPYKLAKNHEVVFGEPWATRPS